MMTILYILRKGIYITMAKSVSFYKNAYLSPDGKLDFFISDSADVEFPHWHDDYEIIMPLSGEYSLSSNNVCYSMTKHDIVMLIPGFLHCLNPISNDSFCLHMRLTRDFIDQSVSNSFLLYTHTPCVFFWNEVSHAVQQHMVSVLFLIKKEVENDRSLLHHPVVDHIYGFLEDSEKYLIEELPLPSSRNHSRKEYIALFQTVCQYIFEHSSAQILDDDLYKLTGFQPTYFCSLFKTSTGISLSDYMIKEKLLFSLRLLTDVSLSIDQISQLSGFSNERTFHRRFRDYFHCTPLQYRKKYLQF